MHWQFSDGTLSRTQAYRWLARRMAIPKEQCHFGMFGEKQLERAIQICSSERPS